MEEFTAEVGCKSVACAVGCGPWAGCGNPRNDNYGRPMWHIYAMKKFGACIEGKLEQTVNAWLWMFQYSWDEFDNTPRGAAKRIYYFLEHGVPDTFTVPQPSAVKIYAKQKPPVDA